MEMVIWRKIAVTSLNLLLVIVLLHYRGVISSSPSSTEVVVEVPDDDEDDENGDGGSGGSGESSEQPDLAPPYMLHEPTIDELIASASTKFNPYRYFSTDDMAGESGQIDDGSNPGMRPLNDDMGGNWAQKVATASSPPPKKDSVRKGTPFVRIELDMILSTDRYNQLRQLSPSLDKLHDNQTTGDHNNNKQKTQPVEKILPPIAPMEVFVPRTPIAKPAMPRNFARDVLLKWPGGVVPYEFANDANFDSNDIAEFEAAIADFHNFTCVKFRPRNPKTDNSYLYIINGDGCYSHVGRVLKKQELSLAPGCRRKGIMQHELMHSIGFYHEQSRPNRDNYIDILQSNVIPWLLHNFDKNTPDQVESFGSKYDYLSIMHYGQTAFSARGDITIRTSDPSFQTAIGQRQVLSFEDVKKVNRAYRCYRGCSGISTTFNAKENEEMCGENAFIGKDCVCWCQPPRMSGFSMSVMPVKPAIRCELLPGRPTRRPALSLQTTATTNTTTPYTKPPKKVTTSTTTSTSTTTTTTSTTSTTSTTTTTTRRSTTPMVDSFIEDEAGENNSSDLSVINFLPSETHSKTEQQQQFLSQLMNVVNIALTSYSNASSTDDLKSNSLDTSTSNYSPPPPPRKEQPPPTTTKRVAFKTTPTTPFWQEGSDEESEPEIFIIDDGQSGRRKFVVPTQLTTSEQGEPTTIPTPSIAPQPSSTAIQSAASNIGITKHAKSTCSDFVAKCSEWASNGDCFRMERFMTNYCPDACGLCGSDPSSTKTTTTTAKPAAECADSEPRCEIWKRFGLCRIASYNDWMAQKCAKSCGICADPNSKPTKASFLSSGGGGGGGSSLNLNGLNVFNLTSVSVGGVKLPSSSASSTANSPPSSTLSSTSSLGNNNVDNAADRSQLDNYGYYYHKGSQHNQASSTPSSSKRPAMATKKPTLRPFVLLDIGHQTDAPVKADRAKKRESDGGNFDDNCDEVVETKAIEKVDEDAGVVVIDGSSGGDSGKGPRKDSKQTQASVSDSANNKTNNSNNNNGDTNNFYYYYKCRDTSISCGTMMMQSYCPNKPMPTMSVNFPFEQGAGSDSYSFSRIIGAMDSKTKRRVMVIRGFMALHCRKTCGLCVDVDSSPPPATLMKIT